MKDPCFETIFTIDGLILGSDANPPVITYELDTHADIYIFDDLSLVTQTNPYLTANMLGVCCPESLDFEV